MLTFIFLHASQLFIFRLRDLTSADPCASAPAADVEASGMLSVTREICSLRTEGRQIEIRWVSILRMLTMWME